MGDSPETLEAVLKAADDPDNLRDAFARSYLKDALEKSNFFELDPEGFNGKTFAGRIRKLGTTGPKLFGKEWNEVKKLSDEIFLSSAKAQLKDQVDRLLDLNGSSPIALGMKDLLDAQVNLNKANNQSIIKKLKNNDYETYDAIAQAT